jgi:hypothetical protein
LVAVWGVALQAVLMALDEEIAERVRRDFRGRDVAWDERWMMGGLCFMVDAKRGGGGARGSAGMGFWIEQALAFNPRAKAPAKKKKKKNAAA